MSDCDVRELAGKLRVRRRRWCWLGGLKPDLSGVKSRSNIDKIRVNPWKIQFCCLWYCTFGFNSRPGPRKHLDITKIRPLVDLSVQVDHHTYLRFVLTPIFEGDLVPCLLASFGSFLTPERHPPTTHQISNPRSAK